MNSPFMIPALLAVALHAAFFLHPSRNCEPVEKPPAVTGEPELPPHIAIVLPEWEPVVDVEPVASNEVGEALEPNDYAPDPSTRSLDPVQCQLGKLPSGPELITLPDGVFDQVAQTILPSQAGPGHRPGGPGSTVFSPRSLDRIPAARLRVPPQYPGHDAPHRSRGSRGGDLCGRSPGAGDRGGGRARSAERICRCGGASTAPLAI